MLATDSDPSVLRKSTFTQSTFSSLLLINAHCEHSTSSAEVTLLSNLENHEKLNVLPIVCSLKATFNIQQLSVAFFLS
jgi:hypothetical protein